jgi:hypothetical protein
VFLCMLAYHLRWHMRQALAAMPYEDHNRAAGEALRSSPIAGLSHQRPGAIFSLAPPIRESTPLLTVGVGLAAGARDHGVTFSYKDYRIAGPPVTRP